MTRSEYLEQVYQICRRGSELPQSKLNEDQVRQIRAIWKPYSRDCNQRTLAERFGVSRRAIERVIAGEVWSHVR